MTRNLAKPTITSPGFLVCRYNKDGDDEEKDNRGRSGYNKDGDDDDEGQNKGRSGYNKDGDDEEDK
ncbi:hypothetical protein CABS01_08727 [Colletotrichum abscissum]|uniref:uncharacterized protein n=1 Tax=Colletotrichum abscissum TaxID=1671311 RepID=UPI0027D4D717|nr:uncharacterized protein CABS01_08727 [Colletotrichum abscissum]KAK1504949.1 hypothetical protein CABS01_08727 [Colletotrichum abscissum]KAK1718609.1 hypothetical protein BDP67DRAFT_575103 [Colletotrichum lupini]